MTQALHADVKLYPFHTTSTSLPDLPGDAWKQLMALGRQGSGAGVQRTAGIILAEPHFVVVCPVSSNNLARLRRHRQPAPGAVAQS